MSAGPIDNNQDDNDYDDYDDYDADDEIIDDDDEIIVDDDFDDDDSFDDDDNFKYVKHLHRSVQIRLEASSVIANLDSGEC